MTPADMAAAEAHDALLAALHQLGQLIVQPLARIDQEARAGYYELHTTMQTIAQRLGTEVGPSIAELATIPQAVADRIAVGEQRRLNAAAAPLQQIQQRLGSDILRGVQNVGR